MSRPPRWTPLVFAIGPIIGLTAIILSVASVSIAPEILPIVACLWVVAVYLTVSLPRVKAIDRSMADGFSDGDSVEVDCRLCGQFNRVPATRLRDHPMCGRCKVRLMPGRRVVICRMNRIEQPLRAELDALWVDETRLWECLADHVAIRNRVDEDRRRSMAN